MSEPKDGVAALMCHWSLTDNYEVYIKPPSHLQVPQISTILEARIDKAGG